MRNDRPKDHQEINARLLAKQTGARVYHPVQPGLDPNDRPSSGWAVAFRVAFFAIASIVLWGGMIWFLVALREKAYG